MTDLIAINYIKVAQLFVSDISVQTRLHTAKKYAEWIGSRSSMEIIQALHAALFGLTLEDCKREFSQKLISLIRATDKEFPYEPSSILLSLRIDLLLAMRQLIEEGTEQSNLVCTAGKSALGAFAPPEPRWLRLILEEFGNSASMTLHENANLVRKIFSPSATTDTDDNETENEPDEGQVESEQATFTRANIFAEELDVIWWVYNRFSTTFNSPFGRLTPAQTSFAVGHELAQIINFPTPESAAAIVVREVEALTKKRSLSLTDLQRVAIPTTVFSKSPAGVAQQFPGIFPVHNLLFGAERNDASPKTTFGCTELALQTFYETILLRELLED